MSDGSAIVMRPRRPRGPALALALAIASGGVFFGAGFVAADPPPSDPEIEALRAEIRAQQAEIDAQRATIESQQEKLTAQEKRLESLASEVERVGERLAATEPASQLAARVEKLEQGALRSPELPTELVTAGEQPGSIRIPGTDKTFRLGGLVRYSMIRTLAPLGSDDRFLSHSIPVGDEIAGEAERFRTNVRPSRLNFDARSPLGDSTLRAFLEGDFASSTGNAFRLRHAYLQWDDLLAGQTWSTFSDPESEPEDLDFEGLNSLNILRQPQVRWSPRLGRGRLAIAIEDSQASIAGAESVNRYPNLVVGRRSRDDRGHLFAAVSLRDLRGQVDGSPDNLDATIGWGVTLAGRRVLPWAAGGDSASFQLTAGEGIATYVADLSAADGQDAVFDAATGRIHALPAAAVSLGYSHAWPDAWRLRQLRSSLVAGFVEVDNLAIQPEDAYHRTLRLSANLVTSPVDGVDLGLQYIWGRRVNKDGADGESSQLQFLAQYRF